MKELVQTAKSKANHVIQYSPTFESFEQHARTVATSRPACVCRIGAEAHSHRRGCVQAGLLNKQLEGARRTPKTYQAVSIHEIMEIRTLVGGLYKLGPDGLEMPDFVGFCESRGVSRGLAVELAKHLPTRAQKRIIEAVD